VEDRFVWVVVGERNQRAGATDDSIGRHDVSDSKPQ
jgi:hypothetical protein